MNLFLRGVVPLLGLRSTIVHYDRRARLAGESKYPLRKMLEFALNGITSFSIAPLRAITFLGFAVSLVCLVLSGWALAVKLTSANAVPGWASTILPIYFLGGVQLFCAGVLGEYVGKIYMEIKRRPRFLIEKVAQRSPARDTGRHGRHRAARGPNRRHSGLPEQIVIRCRVTPWPKWLYDVAWAHPCPCRRCCGSRKRNRSTQPLKPRDSGSGNHPSRENKEAFLEPIRAFCYYARAWAGIGCHFLST